jgi:hypothetical protein
MFGGEGGFAMDCNHENRPEKSMGSSSDRIRPPAILPMALLGCVKAQPKVSAFRQLILVMVDKVISFPGM